MMMQKKTRPLLLLVKKEPLFHKVVLQHIEGVVGYLVMSLL